MAQETVEIAVADRRCLVDDDDRARVDTGRVLVRVELDEQRCQGAGGDAGFPLQELGRGSLHGDTDDAVAGALPGVGGDGQRVRFAGAGGTERALDRVAACREGSYPLSLVVAECRSPS